MEVQLVEINQRHPDQDDVALLFCLLSERESHQNISHKRLPGYQEHEAFIRSCPYASWYLIHGGARFEVVGAIYLTHQREVGIHIFKKHQGLGYGPQAVELLKERHPGKFLANIAPSNLESIEMFRHLGFRKIQETWVNE